MFNTQIIPNCDKLLKKINKLIKENKQDEAHKLLYNIHFKILHNSGIGFAFRNLLEAEHTILDKPVTNSNLENYIKRLKFLQEEAKKLT